METREGICKFCLKISDSFKDSEGVMKEVLNKLLPKIKLVAIQESLMCTNCADIFIKCFDFKAAYLDTYDYIVSIANNKGTVKPELKDVYLSKSENNTDIPGDQGICRFCIGSIKNQLAIPLNVEIADVALEKIIERLPELDLSISKKPVICLSCHAALENYFRFVINCIEEKTKKYCETVDVSSEDAIEISEIEGNLFDKIKVEKQFCEERENVDDSEIANIPDISKLEQSSWDDTYSVTGDIEHKYNSYLDMDDLKLNNEEQFAPKDMLDYKDKCNNVDIKVEKIFCGENGLKEGSSIEMEDYQFLHNEKIELKTDEEDFDRFQEVEVATESHSKQISLKSKHELENNKSSTVIMYRCDSCPFQAKYKSKLRGHMLVHKNPEEVTMYKCDSCSFETKYWRGFNRHLLIHRNPSEITMYECDSCSFKTKYKDDLKKHVLVHKDPSEVTMYKCESCSFETKYWSCINRHSLVHKNPSEVTMYKCDSCSFETKYERYIRKHLLLHKNPSKIAMHKCDSCSYETKYGSCLKKHSLMHTNTSEVTMYKCDSCSLQTKYKGHLKKHMLVHKNPSEVTMYKCDSCSFETKYENYLKRHSLIHRDLSEVTVYKCDSCSYQTNNGSYLKKHSVMHMNPSEVTMYKCDSCSYETKYGSCFKKHSLIHMNPGEVTMYKCDSCSFQAKDKGALKKHMLVHKNPSEVTVYRCDSCSYQTKYESWLKKHSLTHMNP